VQLLTAIAAWSAGIVLAALAAAHSARAVLHHSGNDVEADSYAIWWVEGSGDPLEVNGTLVMPADTIQSPAPTTPAAVPSQSR
jgi:hypothetical protein